MLYVQPQGCRWSLPRSGSPVHRYHQPLVETAGGRLVIQRAQPQLLEMVLALQLPRRLRAACTAGSNSEIRIPMSAMTTSISTKVNPLA